MLFCLSADLIKDPKFPVPKTITPSFLNFSICSSE